MSAIVVSYRSGPILRRTLAALAGQPELAEILLVDNGNPSGMQAELDRLAAAGTIRLLRSAHNLGFGAACNRAAAEARGDLLLVLNPDAIMPPGGLGRMLAAMEGRPRPWLAGARLVGEDGRERRGGRRGELTPWTAFTDALGFGTFNWHDRPLPSGPLPVPTVSGACFLVPAADFRALGGFDEGYFLHVEDIDLCRRLRQAGGTVWFLPDVAVEHEGGSSDAPSFLVERHKLKSFARFFRRHYRGRLDAWLALALITLRFRLRTPLLRLADRRRALLPEE
ncbi:MAG: glycosyltransferase family 2 protein [Pseudomonadota bacterium]